MVVVIFVSTRRRHLVQVYVGDLEFLAHTLLLDSLSLQVGDLFLDVLLLTSGSITLSDRSLHRLIRVHAREDKFLSKSSLFWPNS